MKPITRQEIIGVLIGAFVLLFVISAIMLFIASIHRPIQGGQYTGQVIELEYESGLIMQTTTVYLKTDPTSSRFETLCVPHAPNNPLIPKLRRLALDQNMTTARYNTPLVVPPWDCATTPVLRSLETS